MAIDKLTTSRAKKGKGVEDGRTAYEPGKAPLRIDHAGSG
jgi:hypothetical protein